MLYLKVTEDERRRGWGNLYPRSYEGNPECRLGEQTKFRVSGKKHIRPDLQNY